MSSLLFYSGAFRGYYWRLIRARRSRMTAAITALKLIVRANGRV